jgi:hypothetical protein
MSVQERTALFRMEQGLPAVLTILGDFCSQMSFDDQLKSRQSWNPGACYPRIDPNANE